VIGLKGVSIPNRQMTGHGFVIVRAEVYCWKIEDYFMDIRCHPTAQPLRHSATN
jgi:hypothetical protein